MSTAFTGATRRTYTLEELGQDWAAAGYYIHHPAIGDPKWVSAPALIYDGAGTVYLAYALNRQNGGSGGVGRVHWRAALVLLMADRTGVYTQPIEVWDIDGTHIDAAPVVLRDAFGAGQHGIGVATSHGEFMMFNWRGFTTAGPRVVHSLVNSLPAPVPTIAGNSADPDWLSAVGNYMLTTNGGTFAVVSHNSQTEEMYLQVLVGANAPILMTPSAAAAARGVNVAAAVFGTLGALAAVCAGIVVCLPRAGFNVGATKVIPADVIKGAASGVYAGAAYIGAGAYSLVAGRSPVVASSSSSSYSSSYVSASAPTTAERTSLIK